MGIDYSIVEAFDQPWKTIEGSVGPYWGMFDADRHPKFAFTGAVEAPNFVLKVIAALAIGLLLSHPDLRHPARDRCAGRRVRAAPRMPSAPGRPNVVDYWVTHYFVLGSQIAMFVGACLLVPLIMIMKQRIEELAAIMFGVKPARLLQRSGASAGADAARLDPYSRPAASRRRCCARHSTASPSSTGPISNASWSSTTRQMRACGSRSRIIASCSGPRFKFVRADRLQGFKAGALRLALEHTAPEAEIIGVLDADYVVHPGLAEGSCSGLRRSQRSASCRRRRTIATATGASSHAVMNREYAGFFDIGMVQRNEVNAIVSHGTMCLVRRQRAGRCRRLVERHHRRGYRSRAHAARARLAGPLHQRALWLGPACPRDFAAYKRQRHRWAYGGVQLIKKHWRAFLPGRSRLTTQQTDGVPVRLADLARRRERSAWSSRFSI